MNVDRTAQSCRVCSLASMSWTRRRWWSSSHFSSSLSEKWTGYHGETIGKEDRYVVSLSPVMSIRVGLFIWQAHICGGWHAPHHCQRRVLSPCLQSALQDQPRRD